MKIAGTDPKTLPVEEVLVLPRGEKQVVFRASGLKDMEPFKKLCPEPIPPTILKADGPVADTDDEAYKAAWAGYQKRRTSYIVINSLIPSAIEWDTVQLDNPSTWNNWDTDLKEAGFFDIECSRILQLVMDANCLNEAKLQRARDVFLHGPVTA
jgi:hypothetical protein